MQKEMQEGSDLSRLGFMFKKISIHPLYLKMWLSVPEFTEAIDHMIATNTTIDNQSVCDLMERVYNEKSAKRSSDFNFYKARRGIKALKKELGN